jgi:mono/diheme cytochrome c family protein
MKLVFGLAACAAVWTGSIALAAQKLGKPLGERPPEAIYAKTCGYCHGTNVGPIILGRSLPVSYIKRRVRGGQNAMPAFRPTEITNAELNKLATWISTSKANPLEHGK